MGEDDPGRGEAHALHEDSERLLRAVDELRALEREKRREKISGRPFRELAERVEAKAREVFRIAGEETVDAQAASRLTEDDAATADLTIEEEAAKR
jgi:signal transduction histidine kinase